MNQKYAPATRRALIAVVDDDPAVRNSLKFSLEIEGFQVRTHARAQDLLDDSDLQACSCFVIDQNMPDMSGLEAVSALRQRRISAPAILITSHPTAALSMRAATARIPIVEKPLFGNALVERIHEAIEPEARSASD